MKNKLLIMLLVPQVSCVVASQTHDEAMAEKFFKGITVDGKNSMPAKGLPEFLQERIQHSNAEGAMREVECEDVLNSKFVLERVPYCFASQVEENVALQLIPQVGCYDEYTTFEVQLQAAGHDVSALKPVDNKEFERAVLEKITKEGWWTLKQQESRKLATAILAALKKISVE